MSDNDALLHNKMVDLQERLLLEENKIDTKFYVLLVHEDCWAVGEVVVYWLEHHAPPKNAYVENCRVQRDRGLVLTIKQRAVLLEIMRRQARLAMKLLVADRIEVP
jgi:hypothetical protein